jgi:hypothetical protein
VTDPIRESIRETIKLDLDLAHDLAHRAFIDDDLPKESRGAVIAALVVSIGSERRERARIARRAIERSGF